MPVQATEASSPPAVPMTEGERAAVERREGSEAREVGSRPGAAGLAEAPAVKAGPPPGKGLGAVARGALRSPSPRAASSPGNRGT